MLLKGIRARGDAKYQNFDNFFEDKRLEKEKVNLSDLSPNVTFFRIEIMFSERFSKNINQYLPSSFSIYFQHSS